MKKRADLRWNSLYPIYFDAKVSIAKGRRVPREYALWWPQAQHLSVACRNLGLQSCLEVSHSFEQSEKRVFSLDGRILDLQVRNSEAHTICEICLGKRTSWIAGGPWLTHSPTGPTLPTSKTQEESRSNSKKMVNSSTRSSKTVRLSHLIHLVFFSSHVLHLSS
jgi:signal recognition particle subunit SRP19